MKKLFALVALLFVSGSASADWKFNPFTSKLDYYEKSVGGGIVSPGTFTWANTNGFVGGPVTASSLTLTGVGNASLTEPNGLSGQVLIATSAITTGHMLVAGSSVTAIDGGVPGTGGGSPTGPDYSVQVSSPGNVALEGFPNFTNNGTTVTFTGVYKVTKSNVSSSTIDGVSYVLTNSTFDVSASTLSVGIVLANGSAGTATQVLTSNGPGVAATFQNAAGGAATAGYYGHGGNSQGYGLNTASGAYCMAMDLPFTLTTSSITVQIQTQDAATGNKFAFGIFTLASVVVSSTMPTSLDTATHGANPFDIPWIGGAKTISAGQYALCFTGMSITAKIYAGTSGAFPSEAWDPTTNVGSSTKGSFPNSVTIPAIAPAQGNGNALRGLYFVLHQ